MTSKLENLEKGVAKLTIEVDAKRFEEGLKYSFSKNKSHFKIDGFRNGKAPRSIVEKMYGVQVLYEDAVDYLLPTEYESAVREHKLQVVSRPDIDIVQIGKEQNLIVTAVVTLKPDVILGDYKAAVIEKVSEEVTDEEVNEEVHKVAEGNARLVTVENRPAQMGDILTIDFEGFVDDVAFEGGKAENYEITIGSKTFIDTFEDQLVGKNTGDNVEVNVSFPENYTSEDLAGKKAIFKVVINEITEKELPEIDDDFAQDVSEFNTLDEYKSGIRSRIQEEKKESAKVEKENRAIRKVVESAKMDIPKIMIENQTDKLIHNFEMRIKQNGLTLEQYLQFSGQNMNSVRESLKNEAEEQVKTSLVLDAIVTEEKITVTEEEFEKKLEELATSMKFDISKVKEGLLGERREEFEDEIKLQKAVELIVNLAKEE
ncbi:MAG TPA: trigger factor [Clostridiales bacterium]|nr:MAG: trigger factor [Clostridiales bacterium GWD2_32_19]HCC07503.1 trigger factor [Clostridiales bacterium]